MSADLATIPRLPGAKPLAKGELRRAQLLSAVNDLLRDRPLAEVHVSEITAAAGVGRSAFYVYFPSKEAAVAELLGGVFEEIQAGAQDLLQRRGDPAVALRRAMTGVFRSWREHRHLILTMLDARGSSAEAHAVWEGWIEMFVEALVETIEAERAAGRAPEGPEPELLARALCGMNERAIERVCAATPASARRRRRSTR